MIFLALAFSAHAQTETTAERCTSNSDDHVKFRIVSVDRGIREPFVLELRIVLKSDDFNRTFMVRLAKTIRETYCKEKNVGIVIFDDKKAAKRTDMVRFLTGQVQVPEVRGFYSLDRQRNLESMSFSTKRGNAYDEVVVQLSADQ